MSDTLKLRWEHDQVEMLYILSIPSKNLSSTILLVVAKDDPNKMPETGYRFKYAELEGMS
jgi:hypothetical protein